MTSRSNIKIDVHYRESFNCDEAWALSVRMPIGLNLRFIFKLTEAMIQGSQAFHVNLDHRGNRQNFAEIQFV